MITNAPGLPAEQAGLRVVARLGGVVDHLLADGATLVLPGGSERIGEAGPVGVIARAHVDRDALGAPELLLDVVGQGGALESRAERCGSSARRGRRGP